MKKNKVNRRTFLTNILSNLTLLFLSNAFFSKRLNAKSKPRIVIIGMGIGGATCLRYLYKFSEFIEIIVVEKNKRIRTGPFSNLVIGNILKQDDISFIINEKKYKEVKFIYEDVRFIDAEKKIISISNKLSFSFDFVILSPGVSFKDDIIEGYKSTNKKIIPHCWDGESDISDFKKHLSELDDNSKIIISSPDYPYRCPPAPYERASLIANYHKELKKNVKILILDSKDSFTKQENFFKEWDLNYKNIIEWIPRKKGGKVIFFDPKKKFVINDQGQTFSGDFIHIIPDQKASNIFFESRLLDNKKDWCEINPISFEIVGNKDIYAVGDSINAWAMPKSAFSANSQAKVLAINLINKILEKEYVDPVFLNTCYSFSKDDRAFSITAWYRLNINKDKIISLGSSESNGNASNSDRKIEAEHAYGWYETMVKNLFL